MTITIDKKEYKVKQTVRALFLFEEIKGEAFAIKTTLDNYLYFYCLLLANNPDFMEWQDFIDKIDDDPEIMMQLTNVIAQQQKIDELLKNGEEAEDGKKKI